MALDALMPEGTASVVTARFAAQREVVAVARGRSAATLMSSASWGTRSPGVEGVYDRHGYTAEMADALAKLAALVDTIVHPRDDVVVPMVTRRKRTR